LNIATNARIDVEALVEISVSVAKYFYNLSWPSFDPILRQGLMVATNERIDVEALVEISVSVANKFRNYRGRVLILSCAKD